MGWAPNKAGASFCFVGPNAAIHAMGVIDGVYVPGLVALLFLVLHFVVHLYHDVLFVIILFLVSFSSLSSSRFSLLYRG